MGGRISRRNLRIAEKPNKAALVFKVRRQTLSAYESGPTRSALFVRRRVRKKLNRIYYTLAILKKNCKTYPSDEKSPVTLGGVVGFDFSLPGLVGDDRQPSMVELFVVVSSIDPISEKEIENKFRLGFIWNLIHQIILV